MQRAIPTGDEQVNSPKKSSTLIPAGRIVGANGVQSVLENELKIESLSPDFWGECAQIMLKHKNAKGDS